MHAALNNALVVSGALLVAGAATAGYDIAQSATPGPVYSTTLNFDEAGGPTGTVATNSWASLGLTSMASGSGDGFVDNFSGFAPWVGPGNAFFGSFGVFMNFSTDLTAMSVDVWDSAGVPSPFGGGLNVILFNDGVQVWDINLQNGGGPFDPIATPAWGGLGDQSFHITTSGGMVFDEVRILGFGFPYETFVDNISWNAVPAPGSVALFGLAALVTRRRRA